MSTITPNLTAGMSRSTAISRMREMARAKIGDTAANALTTLGALRDVLNNGAPSEYSIYNYEPGSSARAKVNTYHNSVSRISMFNYIFDQSIGLFIDPSDLSTLFQDSTGTIPVTAPGQPVGLALDKSRGLVPGPELVTNGMFATDTVGWTPLNGATLSKVSGGMRVLENGVDGAVARAYQVISTVIGATYKITGSVIAGSTVSGVFAASPTTSFSGQPNVVVSAGSSGSLVFTATTTTTNIILAVNSIAAGLYSDFTNISVRELPGNHATQATSGSRPLYALLPSNGVRNLANGSADVGNNSVWASSSSTNGITVTKIGSGFDTDGLPYADYTVVGTATANSFATVTLANPFRVPAVSGQTFTVSVLSRLIAGTQPPANCGVRPDANGENTVPTTTESFTAITATVSSTETTHSITGTLANAGTVQVRPYITIRTENGSTVNYTVRIKALQFERGSTRTAYQFNYSSTNITQPPFAQVGALRFDGSDDFLSTPPVGFSRYTTDGSPVRNLMVGASQPNTDVGWITTQSQNGITLTKIGSGTDTDGLPYVDYSVVGTATAQVYLVPNSYSTYPASLGQTYTNSAFFKILSGTPALNTVPIIEVAEVTSADAYITGSGSTPIAPTTHTLITTTRTFNQATMGKVRMYVVIPPPGGSTVNYTFRLKGLQSELGSTRTAYQRTEYTDKVTVFAGVRKLSDATQGTVVELTAGGTNRFSMFAPLSAADGYRFVTGGTTPVNTSAGVFAAPDTAVLTGLGNISGDSVILRRNGTQIGSGTSDQGTGNFANDIIYIGRRGGTTFPFNGYLYHLVLVGKTLTSDQIYAIENYVNTKTGAY